MRLRTMHAEFVAALTETEERIDAIMLSNSGVCTARVSPERTAGAHLNAMELSSYSSAVTVKLLSGCLSIATIGTIVTVVGGLHLAYGKQSCHASNLFPPLKTQV